MTPDEIIAQLTRSTPEIPREALAAADQHRAELTPRLLAALAEVVAQPRLLEEDRDLQLPFYAMYLLAAWREPLALPLLIAFLRLPGEQAVDLSGDIIPQDMGHMLAQTAGGRIDLLTELAQDRTVNRWSRIAAIKSLALVTHAGELPREQLVATCRNLLANAEPPKDPHYIAGEVLCVALDLRLLELRDELLVLLRRGWIAPALAGGADEVAEEFAHPRPSLLRPPIVDVAKAVSWWGCFTRRRAARPPVAPAAAPVRAAPKTGRNDPCPCGSGRKYKKCCGA